MIKSKLFISLILCALLSALLLTGCSKDEKNSTEPSVTFEIIGTWESTYIEGWGPVHGGNSTWIFMSDSTYTWFLDLHTRQYNSAGNYIFDGEALDCGVFSILVGPSTVNISTGENTFSFLDVNNDRWTYTKAK